MTQITSTTPSHQPRGYLFDLDGTLVDSLRDITAALNAARSDLGMILVESNQVRSWVGDGLAALCRRSAPDADNATQTRLVQRAAQRYAERPVVDTAPYPNILQLLNLLRARSSAMAVLSNKPHALTVEILARLNLSSYFAVIQGSQREEERKPDPRAALRIAGTLGATPHDVYLIGDSRIDIQTARNAGMKSVAVTWGYQDRDVLTAADPDFCLDEPLKIAALP
jgi:phosphoglycolate phosphatase